MLRQHCVMSVIFLITEKTSPAVRNKHDRCDVMRIKNANEMSTNVTQRWQIMSGRSYGQTYP